jgi:opacity protein-like surface antigen
MGKKLILFFALFIGSLNSLHGEENEFGFIGMGIGAYGVSFDDNTSLPSENISTVALRMGRQTRRMRTLFSIEYSSELAGAGIFIDYIPFDTMFGTPYFRPYIGLHAQYLRYQSGDTDEEGFGMGGQVGLLIYASDTIDVDLSYRYGFIQNSDILDSIDGFTLSLHYFYD